MSKKKNNSLATKAEMLVNNRVVEWKNGRVVECMIVSANRMFK